MDEYRELIDSFCKLSIASKQNEIKDELQELLMVLHRLCIDKNVNDIVLLHPEMKKIEEQANEEDFLNGIYAYIISIKESMGKYLN